MEKQANDKQCIECLRNQLDCGEYDCQIDEKGSCHWLRDEPVIDG